MNAKRDVEKKIEPMVLDAADKLLSAPPLWRQLPAFVVSTAVGEERAGTCQLNHVFCKKPQMNSSQSQMHDRLVEC